MIQEITSTVSVELLEVVALERDFYSYSPANWDSWCILRRPKFPWTSTSSRWTRSPMCRVSWRIWLLHGIIYINLPRMGTGLIYRLMLRTRRNRSSILINWIWSRLPSRLDSLFHQRYFPSIIFFLSRRSVFRRWLTRRLILQLEQVRRRTRRNDARESLEREQTKSIIRNNGGVCWRMGIQYRESVGQSLGHDEIST